MLCFPAFFYVIENAFDTEGYAEKFN